MADETRDIASPVFTREEAHDVYERVCNLIHQRNELREEVAHLQETLGMFAALRDLMHDDAPSLHHVASNNGHVLVAHDVPIPCYRTGNDERQPLPDAAGDVLIVEVGGLDDDPGDSPRDDQADGDRAGALTIALDENPAADDLDVALVAHDVPVDERQHLPDDAGDVSTVEASALDADAADMYHGDTQGDASGITLAPPVSPSPTPRPVPDSPIASVEASTTAAPSPPVEAMGKAPLPGTLKARILEVVERSSRPRRPWQIRQTLGLERLPSAELSALVKQGHLVRVKEGCYGLPGKAYDSAGAAESDNL